MDIGTAKPSRDERTRIPHHLIDIVDPDENFSLAEFQKTANQAINNIQRNGKLPLLVGGTGQYIKAITEGWTIPKVAPDYELRARLEKRAENGEGDNLHKELEKIDPEGAKQIDKRNVRRVIRALEVVMTSGTAFSKLTGKSRPPYQIFTIGLTADRKTLYQRTDSRADKMIETGLIGEVEKLMRMGYSPELPAMSGIGYRQISKYLKGEASLAAAVDNIKTETHRFIRHQYNWFRLDDEGIRWYDIGNPDTESTIMRAVVRLRQSAATGQPASRTQEITPE